MLYHIFRFLRQLQRILKSLFSQFLYVFYMCLTQSPSSGQLQMICFWFVVCRLVSAGARCGVLRIL